jgi:ribonuclease D
MNDGSHLLKEPRGGVPSVIQTREEFEKALLSFNKATGPVAADAERASGFRYGHEDWLIQFKRDDDAIYLFDPVSLRNDGADITELNTVLSEETLILHDALQDLPGFADIGLRPKRLFDTEFAARLLNFSHLNLSAVTEECLGLCLAKEHSAADWSFRPLPRDWRNYAALDVELLIPLMNDLEERLVAAGKDEWAQEEFAQILRQGMTPRETQQEPWRHTSHITTLRNDRQGLAIVRALWNKRDELAKQLDIAPSLLLSDKGIIEAAIKKPRSKRMFQSIRSLSDRVHIYRGGEVDNMFARYIPLQKSIKSSVWRQTIQDALEIPEAELPKPSPKTDPIQNIPHSMRYWAEEFPDLYAELMEAKQALEQTAARTNTPVDLILKSSILNELIWTHVPQDGIADFLRVHGVRPWQIELVVTSFESLTRV